MNSGEIHEFKLYIIQDYTRLKSDENSRLSLEWNLNREISKINYRIYTDAIKEHLIVTELSPRSNISCTQFNTPGIYDISKFIF